MLFFSHAVIADELIWLFEPKERGNFYFGAIFPDIRYYLDIPREKTHFDLDYIIKLRRSFPGASSFIDGYFLHCLIDKYDLTQIVKDNFWYKLIKRWLPSYFIPVLIEFYFLDTRVLQVHLAADDDVVYYYLQMDVDKIRSFAKEMEAFFSKSDMESAFEITEKLGLIKKEGIQKYIKVARFLQKHKKIRRFLFGRFKMDEFMRKTYRLLNPEIEKYYKKVSPSK